MIAYTSEELLKILFDYTSLLTEEYDKLNSFAFTHGIECSEEVIKKAEKLRAILKHVIDNHYYMQDRPNIINDSAYKTIFEHHNITIKNKGVK